MKTLIWKFRYARHLRKLVGISWRFAWQHAEACLADIIAGDLAQCPLQCAEEERDEWLACC